MRQATSDALIQAGLNLIGQALSIYDDQLRLAVCNRRFGEMFDLPDALLTPGARFEDTIRHLALRGEYGAVTDMEAFIRPRVEQARAFEPHYLERQRSNGRWISVEGAPLAEGGWVTVYTDITATRAQEELLRTRSEALSEEVLRRSEELSQTNRELAATVTALEETQRQLRASEARRRLTTEMMPAHIAHVDGDGVYTYSNQRLSDVIPGRPNDIIGRHISDALGPDAFAKVSPHLEAACSGRPSTFEFTEAASQRRIRVALTPDPSRNGAYILSMDITQETQARAALQQSRRRAAAAQLVSGMAHDFSNLLTIIMGLQSKLGGMQDLPDGAADLIEATQAAARRGGRLLERIGDMTGARAWQPKPIDLSAFLDDLAILAGASLPEAISLDIACGVDGQQLIDPGMLQDALLNLILNARDACAGQGEIRLSAARQGDSWLCFTVQDTGPGFSSEAMARGFEPFFSTKGGEGTGLGLVMVYDTAQLAGGDVKRANTDEGARVTLRLPWRAVTTQVGQLVLIVEDSVELRAGLRDMLVADGHAVVEAGSVAEALELAETLPGITHVLSDIVLEGDGTGLDLRRALSAVSVTLMTSLPVSDPRHRAARETGLVLRKPLEAAHLREILQPNARAAS